LLFGALLKHGKKLHNITNSIWEKVLKTCVNRWNGFNKELMSNKILMFGKQLQVDIDEEDSHEFIGIEVKQQLSNQLIKLEEERSNNRRQRKYNLCQENTQQGFWRCLLLSAVAYRF
jgi:hypothetical protein